MNSPTPSPAASASILVAEDNPINQEVILEQLELLGHAADVAADGQQAFDRWQQGRYVLLLTDLQMPRMDGYQLARAVRAHEAQHGRPRTCIVALTARTMQGEDERCRQAGMDDHLSKPVELADLQLRLQRWLSPATAVAGPPPEQPPLPVEAEAPAPLMDVDALSQYVGDDPDTLLQFRTDFQQRLGALRAAMASASEHDDHADLGGLAHQLKSASRTLGALLLSQRCEALEHAARAGQADGVRQLWPQVAEAIAATDQALQALLPPRQA